MHSWYSICYDDEIVLADCRSLRSAKEKKDGGGGDEI